MTSAPATHDPAPPIAGYDKLGERDLIRELRQHSQADLDRIDGYERAHRAREPVLDKLRYLRGPQPLSGYDDMDVAAVLAELPEAGLPTLNAVRSYETKFRHRPEVLDGVARQREGRNPGRGRAEEPVAPAPSSPATRRIRAAGVNIGITGLLIVAVVLAIASVFVGFFVVLSVVAPNASL
jgi:hypothetical protein